MLQLKYKTLLKNSYINTPLRLQHLLAQIDAESNMIPQSENLNYSSERLRKVFPKYFPTISISNLYSGNPTKIANKIYANRMGNGDESSGDGFKYRGRGFIQLTGKNNYLLLSKHTGLDFVSNPDLLLEESNSLISAIWYWNSNNLNKFADLDDLDSISDIINIGRRTSKYGDANGFDHRKKLLLKWKSIIK